MLVKFGEFFYFIVNLSQSRCLEAEHRVAVSVLFGNRISPVGLSAAGRREFTTANRPAPMTVLFNL